MTKTELSELSEVARPTIERWATGRRKPQSAPVNAVADALGIDREHALQLAGVIKPKPLPSARRGLSPEAQRLMREELGDELGGALIAHAEHLASGRTGESGGVRPPESGGRDRQSG